MEYTSHSEHKQELIRGIVSDMRHSLNQKQISELNRTLINRLEFVEILNKELPFEQDVEKENQRLVDLFVDDNMRFVFVFTKEDHNKLKMLWKNSDVGR